MCAHTPSCCISWLHWKETRACSRSKVQQQASFGQIGEQGCGVHHGFYLPHSTDAAQVAHWVFITALMEKLEGMQLWTVWKSLSHGAVFRVANSALNKALWKRTQPNFYALISEIQLDSKIAARVHRLLWEGYAFAELEELLWQAKMLCLRLLLNICKEPRRPNFIQHRPSLCCTVSNIHTWHLAFLNCMLYSSIFKKSKKAVQSILGMCCSHVPHPSYSSRDWTRHLQQTVVWSNHWDSQQSLFSSTESACFSSNTKLASRSQNLQPFIW